jgi:NAD(P)-dependent dehydrogenase (short-subunit alcohol dehydrogenase family)
MRSGLVGFLLPKPIANKSNWLISAAVTGCSSGLGAAFVTHIAKAGHRVVATARKVSTLDYLEDGPNVLKLKLDVTSAADITAVVTATVEKFGRIDVLINNAGYGLMGDFESVTDMDARKQFETNFWGAINMTREVLRVFREVNPIGLGGTVVQVSSMGGFIGFPGNAFYHAR